MPWAKVDDKLHGHPKAIEAGLEALGLWTLALSWVSSYLTDGFVPEGQIVRIGGSIEMADKLIAAGLWERRDGGYQIHDYLEYNPSAEEIDEQRAKNRRKQQLYDDPYLTRQVKARDGNHCRYCSIEVNWRDRKGATGGTYDHVDPEGGNSLDNIVVACRSCNAKKSNRTPEEAQMPLLSLIQNEPSMELEPNQTESAIPIPSPPPVPSPSPKPEPKDPKPVPSIAAAKPPKRPRKPKKAKKPSQPVPAAVKVFRETLHKYPSKILWDDIVETVGENEDKLQEWAKLLKSWVGRGYNPVNVEGQLDAFRAGGLPKRDKGKKKEPASFEAIRQFIGTETAQ